MTPQDKRNLLRWLRERQTTAIKLRKLEWALYSNSKGGGYAHLQEHMRQQGRADAFFEVLTYLRERK